MVLFTISCLFSKHCCGGHKCGNLWLEVKLILAIWCFCLTDSGIVTHVYLSVLWPLAEWQKSHPACKNFCFSNQQTYSFGSVWGLGVTCSYLRKNGMVKRKPKAVRYDFECEVLLQIFNDHNKERQLDAEPQRGSEGGPTAQRFSTISSCM